MPRATPYQRDRRRPPVRRASVARPIKPSTSYATPVSGGSEVRSKVRSPGCRVNNQSRQPADIPRQDWSGNLELPVVAAVNADDNTGVVSPGGTGPPRRPRPAKDQPCSRPSRSPPSPSPGPGRRTEAHQRPPDDRRTRPTAAQRPVPPRRPRLRRLRHHRTADRGERRRHVQDGDGGVQRERKSIYKQDASERKDSFPFAATASRPARTSRSASTSSPAITPARSQSKTRRRRPATR